MDPRFNIAALEPEGYKAMIALENYLATTKVDKMHKELIKIRTSQINGCAFCIDMHTKDARKYGETEQRIYLLNAWRETNLFNEAERVVLALAEEMALIANGGLSEETYQKAKALFDDHYIAQLIMVAVTINAWNRIAISSHLQPAS